MGAGQVDRALFFYLQGPGGKENRRGGVGRPRILSEGHRRGPNQVPKAGAQIRGVAEEPTKKVVFLRVRLHTPLRERLVPSFPYVPHKPIERVNSLRWNILPGTLHT